MNLELVKAKVESDDPWCHAVFDRGVVKSRDVLSAVAGAVLDLGRARRATFFRGFRTTHGLIRFIDALDDLALDVSDADVVCEALVERFCEPGRVEAVSGAEVARAIQDVAVFKSDGPPDLYRTLLAIIHGQKMDLLARVLELPLPPATLTRVFRYVWTYAYLPHLGMLAGQGGHVLGAAGAADAATLLVDHPDREGVLEAVDAAGRAMTLLVDSPWFAVDTIQDLFGRDRPPLGPEAEARLEHDIALWRPEAVGQRRRWGGRKAWVQAVVTAPPLHQLGGW